MILKNCPKGLQMEANTTEKGGLEHGRANVDFGIIVVNVSSKWSHPNDFIWWGKGGT